MVNDAHRNVVQYWLCTLPFMQQAVLLSAIRGPDGAPKFHPCKPLMKWYRRCIVLCAMDGKSFVDPFTPGGGSFTGPSKSVDPTDLNHAVSQWPLYMVPVVDAYLEARDELPHHFQMHAMHAFEIIGYRHPNLVIRDFWNSVYVRIVRAMHLSVETLDQMNERLGDNLESWKKHADISELRGGCTVSCSD